SMSRSRNPPPRGQGAARAKQMGLLLDLSPDGGMDDGGNEEELEAELMSLIGGGGGGRSPGKKPGGRSPVPMAEIERMAALCMKDLDDDEGVDEDLEDDEDLLAELNEVLEDDDEGETPNRAPPAAPPASRLTERIDMYKTAISNAKAAGESSKARRYDRGLKTLQSMLASVMKGKPINEEEIPPPVATGGKPNLTAQPELIKEREPPEPALMPSPPTSQKPLREAPPTAPNVKPQHLTPPQKPAAAVTPDTPAVLSRQREYKIAAIQAKQGGDTDLAKRHYLIAKKMDVLVETLDAGEPVDLSALPAPPGQLNRFTLSSNQISYNEANIAEALQQRMDKYKAAAEGAKSKGDDRKARMHQRIVKQYQDAIRAHKAGRPVNLSDLPVPPGCPPLQGGESGQQNFMGVLETAMKLANQDADAEEEDGAEEVAKVTEKVYRQIVSLSMLLIIPAAQQQLDFLLLRRQAFIRAALRSKQMKDMTGAAQHLRHAKGLDAMITAAKSGLPVDISKIPSAPVSEEDYSLSRSRTSPLSPRSSEQYSHLMGLLRQQHEVRTPASQPHYTHVYTQVFEKLADECMKNIEILKKAHAKGQPAPKYHTEERTFNTVKIYPNLTPNDMILYIIRGVNLPTPAGVSPSDLDASVRFEFPFPSAEEAQRDKTSTVKSTNSPEFKEQFKLNINRTQRSFKRVVQSKGIKFEIIHKGGLFKTDKVIGNAQLKLEGLDNQCDIRDIIEVLDGRKATGGKLEVRVKIREPLGGVHLQSVTENVCVCVCVCYKLHSFSLLNYDKERLERKIAEYRKNRRDPPADLIHQHKEVTHRLQWQKAHLERGSPALLAGNTNIWTMTYVACLRLIHSEKQFSHMYEPRFPPPFLFRV
uniref:Coiled-coil and C2 domain-containing protein 1B n=1 Tax=Myripristis murdjan TaxID=586833 RepID=A0A667ZEV0_9TELE